MLQRLQALVWPQPLQICALYCTLKTQCNVLPLLVISKMCVFSLLFYLFLLPAKHFLLPAKHAQATLSSSSSPNPPWQFYTGLPFFPRLIAESSKRFFYFGIWTPTIEIAISQDAPKYECVRVSTRLASPQIRKIPSFATSCYHLRTFPCTEGRWGWAERVPYGRGGRREARDYCRPS